jgi:hypothetical protein
MRKGIYYMQANYPLTNRPIFAIAREISKDWGDKVNYAAKPYLAAMYDLSAITDNYYDDSGKSVVLYFLSNAASWRGDVAKRIKLELKGMCK